MATHRRSGRIGLAKKLPEGGLLSWVGNAPNPHHHDVQASQAADEPKEPRPLGKSKAKRSRKQEPTDIDAEPQDTEDENDKPDGKKRSVSTQDKTPSPKRPRVVVPNSESKAKPEINFMSSWESRPKPKRTFGKRHAQPTSSRSKNIARTINKVGKLDSVKSKNSKYIKEDETNLATPPSSSATSILGKQSPRSDKAKADRPSLDLKFMRNLHKGSEAGGNEMGDRPNGGSFTPISLIEDDAEAGGDKVEGEGTPKCPMCKKTVASEALAKFRRKHPAMTFKHMERFCLEHRREDARVEWKKEGLPTMEWNGLEERMEQHAGDMEAILQDRQVSVFGVELEEMVKKGKYKKAMKQQMDSGNGPIMIEIGYYGWKGLLIITHYLVERFSERLRALDLSKQLLELGTNEYVQMVLVPEMAIRLIMEDMKVGAEQARALMERTVDLGVLLHPDEDTKRERKRSRENWGKEGQRFSRRLAQEQDLGG